MAECIDLRDARRDDDYRLVSELFREYFVKLREEGFSRKEAMQIVLDYQRMLVLGSQSE